MLDVFVTNNKHICLPVSELKKKQKGIRVQLLASINENKASLSEEMPKTLNLARMSYNERMDRKNRKVLLKNLHDLKMAVSNSKLDMKKLELLQQSKVLMLCLQ